MQRNTGMLLAVLIAACCLLCSLPTAAARERAWNVTSLTNYSLDPVYNKGCYFEPTTEGKFPVLVLVHGAGGPEKPYFWMPFLMNRWIRMGVVIPMVVVMPHVEKLKDRSYGIPDFGEFVSLGRFKALVEYIKAGKLTSKADTSAPISMTGYSMGGSATLFAGVKHRDFLFNIGGLSPSWTFYDGTRGYITDPDEMIFSNNDNGHFVMGYGAGEPSQHHKNVLRYNETLSKNGHNKPGMFRIYEAPAVSSKGQPLGHAWELFSREIFYFLYYLKFGSTPSADLVEKACEIEG